MEFVARFLLGGAVVSAFALAGELFKPKRFGGMFGAAPSVALATLALAFSKRGPAHVAIEARSMVIGGFALFAYCVACIVATKARRIPVWITAIAAWALWLAVALGLCRAAILVGVLR